jgi:hypothetical protein
MDSFNDISAIFAAPYPDSQPDHPTDADGNGWGGATCLIV